MSYFDKKRHFYNSYIFDIQYSNNFKKKRVGIFANAGSRHIFWPFSQVSFLNSHSNKNTIIYRLKIFPEAIFPSLVFP